MDSNSARLSTIALAILALVASAKGEAAPLGDFFLGSASPYGGQQAGLSFHVYVLCVCFQVATRLSDVLYMSIAWLCIFY